MKDTERTTPATATDVAPTGHPGRRPDAPEDPAERPLGPPGGVPDVDGPVGADRERHRRDELARRSGAPGPSPAGRDRPDMVPDVEPPDLPM